eukprot:COSAG03_NODE_14721_length_454_cov_1.163380_1_plen_75_part_01
MPAQEEPVGIPSDPLCDPTIVDDAPAGMELDDGDEPVLNRMMVSCEPEPASSGPRSRSPLPRGRPLLRSGGAQCA